MSSVQQLQLELQNELSTSNQLLRLISLELQQIKQFTHPAGDFAENIIRSAALMSTLANMQKIDIQNLPPMARLQTDLNNHINSNQSHEQQSFRDNNMDDSQ